MWSDGRRASWRRGARAGWPVGLAAVLAAGVALAALPPDGSAPPPGDLRWQRSLRTLESRQTILASQAGMAAGVARWRARELYRYLRTAPDAAAGSEQADADRARAIMVGLRALERELGEARILDRELAQARADRAALPPAAAAAAGPTSEPISPGAASPAPPLFTAPLAGASVVVGSGPGRERATGIWLVRSGLRLRGHAGDSVRAMADGVVNRVAPSSAGGLALVVDDGGGWTSILDGLGAVWVTPGARVRRGQPVGRLEAAPAGAAPPTLTVDLWRGRTSADPAKYVHF